MRPAIHAKTDKIAGKLTSGTHMRLQIPRRNRTSLHISVEEKDDPAKTVLN